VATGVVTHINVKAVSTLGKEDAGGKPGCIVPSQGGRARTPSVNDVEATGVAKQTSAKAGSTPECSGGADVATGIVPGTEVSTQESVEEEGVGRPGCIPPSHGWSARPMSETGGEATGVAKHASDNEGSTPSVHGERARRVV